MPVIDPILVNTTTAGHQEDPKAAQNKFGEIAVCWTQKQLSGVRDGNQIIVQLYDATGQKNGGELLINDATSNVDALYSSHPANSGIFPQSDGTFILAMPGKKNDSATSSVFARKINRDGTFATDLTEIIDTTVTGNVTNTYYRLHATSEGIINVVAALYPPASIEYPWHGLYASIYDFNTSDAPSWITIDTLAASVGRPKFIHQIDTKTIGVISEKSGDIFHTQLDIEAKTVLSTTTVETETTSFDKAISLNDGYFTNFWAAGTETFAQVFEPNATPYSNPIVAAFPSPATLRIGFRDTLNGFHWLMQNGSSNFNEQFTKYGGAEYAEPRYCDEFSVKRPGDLFGLALHDGGHLKVWSSIIGTPLDDDDGYGIFMARFDKTNTPANVDTPFTLEYLEQNTSIPVGGTGGETSGGSDSGTGSVSCCASGVNITVHVHNNDDCCGS